LRRFLALTGILLLTGCTALSTVSDYNKNLTDYTGDKKVGVAFDIHNAQVRVYPQVKTCIDLYSKNNGFVPDGVAALSDYHGTRKIGVPAVEGMNQNNQEFWVNANDYLAVRVIYTGKKDTTNFLEPKFNVAESIIAFKPQPGAFYYVTINFDYQDPQTGKYLRIYQIVDDNAGKKRLKHVEILNFETCPGQKPWYLHFGAVI